MNRHFAHVNSDIKNLDFILISTTVILGDS